MWSNAVRSLAFFMWTFLEFWVSYFCWLLFLNFSSLSKMFFIQGCKKQWKLYIATLFPVFSFFLWRVWKPWWLTTRRHTGSSENGFRLFSAPTVWLLHESTAQVAATVTAPTVCFADRGDFSIHQLIPVNTIITTSLVKQLVIFSKLEYDEFSNSIY